MVRSRRRWSGVVCAAGVAATLLVSGCATLRAEPAQERIVIGADLELTGDRAAVGTVFEQALQLRVDQVNEQGLLGDRRLELVVRDNRSDSATSAANLAELTNDRDVVTVVTGACGECTVDSAGFLESTGVPVISLASASGIVEPVEERSHLFKLGPTAEDNARVLVGEATRAGSETIALVTPDTLYGAEAREAVTDSAERAGLELVVDRTVADSDAVAGVVDEIVNHGPDDSSLGYDPSLPSTTPSGPDAVVLWLPPALAHQAAVELRNQGYEGDLLLDALAAGELFLSGEAREALQGARMVFPETLVIDSVVATSPARAARQAWFRDYTAEQGTYHAYSSFAADAIQLVVEAVNQADGTDRAALRQAMEDTQIDGFSGPIRIRLENHAGLSPQALTTLVVQGDRWRLAT